MTQMLVDCHGGRRRRYWCAARDSLVRAMEDHLRHLGRTGEQPLPVERVGTWEVSCEGLGDEMYAGSRSSEKSSWRSSEVLE